MHFANLPVPDKVTHACRKSASPKQIFVTNGSGNGICECAPSGVIVVMPPLRIVATQILPDAAMARLSKYCKVGIAATTRPLLKGLARAICRVRPLLQRRQGSGVSLIVDHKALDVGILEELHRETGKVTGTVPGLSLPATEEHEAIHHVHFAEAVHMSLGYADNRLWLLLKPDVWIWPRFARQHATNFLDKRKTDRRNDKHDRLLSAWIGILSDHAGNDVEVTFSPFDGDAGSANPVFGFSTQTGFAMKRGRT